MKTFVVTDIQNDFLAGAALVAPAGDAAVPVLNRCIGEVERLGLPVFATRDRHAPAARRIAAALRVLEAGESVHSVRLSNRLQAPAHSMDTRDA